MVEEAAGAMNTFGKLERDGAPTRLPALTPRRNEPPAEQKPVMSASLREQVIEQIEPSVAATVSREVLRRQIEEIIHGIANHERLELSGREQLQLADELADDMTGYGPLRPLLLDESINDVMVNGPSNIYVERKGKLERVAIRFRDNDHIASVAQKIAARVGRRIDESSPMVDCRLPDGSRVNIIFPPLAIHSPCISIRKFPAPRHDPNGDKHCSIRPACERSVSCHLS
jgi:pilus assembly protein CpaF